MSSDVVIIGASGHGKVIADIVLRAGDRLVGFLDDNPELCRNVFGFSLLGGVSSFQQFQTAQFVIAIGNASVRRQIAERLKGVKWYTAIHPNAAVSSLGTSVGCGTVVMANAVINPGAQIGAHCIINSGAVVEHDNRIGDFVHISVGTKLAGTVSVGNGSWIGIGAVVSNNISVCEDCIVGAGAVVTKDIEEAGTYVGVPARRVH